MSEKTYGVGVVGYDFMGRTHTFGYHTIPFFYQELPINFALTGVCVRRPETLDAAVKEGHQAVIDALRTNNMYPPTVFADPIATAIEGLFGQDGNMSAELFFDDKELFVKETEEVDEVENESEEEVKEDVDVDELLDDNIEDDLSDDKVIKKLKTNLQTAKDADDTVKGIG